MEEPTTKKLHGQWGRNFPVGCTNGTYKKNQFSYSEEPVIIENETSKENVDFWRNPEELISNMNTINLNIIISDGNQY